MLYFMRRYEDAVREGKTAIELHEGFSRGHVMLGLACEGAGQFDLAVGHFKRAFELEEHATPLAALGHAYAQMEKPAKARAALSDLRKLEGEKKQLVSPYFHALIHAGLGDAERAIDCLEKSYIQQGDWLIHAGVEPRWEKLRSHPRFQRLLEKLKLSQYQTTNPALT